MSDPKFDFSKGAGAPLGSLPCFTTVKRGKKTKALEAAIEPLHRLVYGRPGQGGERKPALEEFQGFPAAMEGEVREKLGNLTKDRLRDLIRALGMRVLISLPVAQVVEGVAAFLMKPSDEGRIKADNKPATAGGAAKRTRSSPPAAGEASFAETATAAADAPAPKRARAEVKATKGTATAASAVGPTEDAVRVQVYRRVLTMSPEERATLGVKRLRAELEGFFGVAEGNLKELRDVVADTAADCVRALMAAEERAWADTSFAVTAPATNPEAPANAAMNVADSDHHGISPL